MYYVYIFYTEDQIPYYVGMGSGRRYTKREIRDAIPRPDDDELTVLIAEDLTREEAWELEKAYISKYKRECDGGTLLNQCTGGPGTPGRKLSQSSKEAIGRCMSRNNRGNSHAAVHTWIITTPEGEEIISHNMAQFCREKGLDKSGMTHASRSPTHSFHGYKVQKISRTNSK
jgi:hypothetical protein